MTGQATAAVDGEVRITFPDAVSAERAAAALAPENDTHLSTRVEGDTLVLVLPHRGIGSTLATLDDAISCLQALIGGEEAAEDAIDAGDD